MRILVTGSAGHLGEALVTLLRNRGDDVVGLDVLPSPHTDIIGSVADRETARLALDRVEAVLHVATLHKPHVATHTRQDFIDTNVTGTLNLLEASEQSNRIRCFVFTSTTSVYGRALESAPGAPAVWVDEETVPVPRNIYGVTKHAAENLVELCHLDTGLPCVILRTSRFFPELDDSPELRDRFADQNVKVNELLYRRVDIEDAASAHLAALEKADSIGFGRYVISAPTPFGLDDLADLAEDAPAVVRRIFPNSESVYERLGWRMFDRIGRVYVSNRARSDLGWSPTYDFAHAIRALESGSEPWSPLTASVGVKGYHSTSAFPYTTR